MAGITWLTGGPTVPVVTAHRNNAFYGSCNIALSTLTTTALFTAPVTGVYEIHAYLAQTAALASGTSVAYTPSFTWTDDSPVAALQTKAMTGILINSGSGELYDQLTFNCRIAGNTTFNAIITVAIVASGTGTTAALYVSAYGVIPD